MSPTARDVVDQAPAGRREAALLSEPSVARMAEHYVHLTSSDLENVIGLLGDEVANQREPEVFLSSLEDNATITVRALVDDPSAAERLQHDLRLRAHRRLRAAGIYT